MPLWDKLKTELDRAGRAAQGALDEGKLRLEAFRVRQLADRAAQTLGYAVYRARAAGGELDADSYARLGAALAAHEAEASRLESQLAEATRHGGGTTGGATGGASAAGSGASGAPSGSSTGPTPPNAPRSGQPGGQADESMPPVNPT